MDGIENDTSNNTSTVACVFVAMVTFLPSHYLASIEVIYIQTHRLMGETYDQYC
jgi:hypothetical protein